MRRFRLKYVGGTGWLIFLTFLAMITVFIPLALTILIDNVEIIEVAPK
jgi:hypothetical protein